MQCPAGMQSRHSPISDFSFPLGMAAMLGPGLQQEGDPTSLFPVICNFCVLFFLISITRDIFKFVDPFQEPIFGFVNFLW